MLAFLGAAQRAAILLLERSQNVAGAQDLHRISRVPQRQRPATTKTNKLHISHTPPHTAVDRTPHTAVDTHTSILHKSVSSLQNAGDRKKRWGLSGSLNVSMQRSWTLVKNLSAPQQYHFDLSRSDRSNFFMNPSSLTPAIVTRMSINRLYSRLCTTSYNNSTTSPGWSGCCLRCLFTIYCCVFRRGARGHSHDGLHHESCPP